MAQRQKEREWLSIAEAAYYVGVNEECIRKAIHHYDPKKRLKAYQRGTNATQRLTWRISKTDLNEWIRTTWETV